MSDVSEFLRWSDAIETGHPQMDDTHREFLALMDEALASDDGSMLARLDALIEHTRGHFDQELAWMQATAFPPIGCHQREHDTVMETALEVRRRVAAGDHGLGRKLVAALAEWFNGHAQGMDKVLAGWMAEHAPGAHPHDCAAHGGCGHAAHPGSDAAGAGCAPAAASCGGPAAGAAGQAGCGSANHGASDQA